jgi:integrase
MPRQKVEQTFYNSAGRGTGNRAGSPPPLEDLLVLEEHLQSYEEHLLSTGKSQRTRQQYRHKLKQWFGWLRGRPPSRGMLMEYRDFLMGRGLRPRTVRQAWHALASFFGYLEEELEQEGLPDVRAIRLPGDDEPRRSTPTEAEVERLERAARRMPAHTPAAAFRRGKAITMVMLLRHAGLRRSELLGLDVGDIDTTTHPWILRVRIAKGAQSRWIPINDELRAWLEVWLIQRLEWGEEAGCLHASLLPVDRNRRLSHKGVMVLWREVVELAGLTGRGFTPHSIRHRFATDVAAASDLPTAAALLGHKSVKTTFNYLKTNPDSMVRAVQALGRGTGAVTPMPPAATNPRALGKAGEQAPPYDTRARRRTCRRSR